MNRVFKISQGDGQGLRLACFGELTDRDASSVACLAGLAISKTTPNFNIIFSTRIIFQLSIDIKMPRFVSLAHWISVAAL
jgi:hypothetical protein